ICRTPGFQVRRHAQGSQDFNRLVSRAVFTLTNGVVGVYEYVAQLHQCRHTYRVSSVLLEHQEGSAVRNEAAVSRNTVHDGAHTEFTYAVIDVVTAGI